MRGGVSLSMKWSEKQEQIINTRETSLLVAAAAGSGKTAVLVERIIQLMVDAQRPLPAEKMVVVTFAKEAAGEMKTRIQKGLEDRLASNPNNEWLATQALHMNQANISTIHSFCQKIIRDYFYEIDISPSFTIGKEEEVRLIKKDALELVMNEVFQEILDLESREDLEDKDRYNYLQSKEKDILRAKDFIDYCTEGRGHKKIEEFVNKIFEISISHPWPKFWFLQSIERMDIGHLNDLVGMKEFLLGQYKLIQGYLDLAKGNYDLTTWAGGLDDYADVALNDIELLEGIQPDFGYGDYQPYLSALEFKRIPNLKKGTFDEGLKASFVDQRKKIKGGIETLQKLFALTEEEQLDLLGKSKHLLEGLSYILFRYMDQFELMKRRRDILDFNDLEHLALKALVERCLKEDEGARSKEGIYWRPTHIAKDLATQIQEIFIDEYQDSNLVQELILESISGEGQGRNNLFTVGDVKQSIYRFRQARPELFTNRYGRYQEEGTEVKIDLHQNFRSRGSVLEGINEIFFPLMKKDIGNIDYDDKAALHPGAKYPKACEILGKTSEVILIEENKELAHRAKLEANWIGQKIMELVGKAEIWDKEKDKDKKEGEPFTYRKVEFKDIVILLRSRTFGETYKEVFQDMNIPVQLEVMSGYFSAIEVVTLINYLSLVTNELQDIPLVSLLKSGMVSLTDEELAQIKLFEPQKSFAESFKGYVSKKEEIPKSLENFYQILRRQREYLSYVSIHQILEEVLEETGYRYYLQSLPNGESRLANVDMLLSQALEFEKIGGQGIFKFLKYIEKMNKYDIDMPLADPLQGESNMVKIMTIHKSKGLEFPICFIGALGQGFNEMDLKGDLIADIDLGMNLDYKDKEKHIRYTSIFKEMIKDRIQVQNLGEEMRVLYVALTRAMEKLYMVGTIKNPKEALDLWKDGHNYLTRRKNKHYLDWIMPSLLESNSEYLSYEVVSLEQVFEKEDSPLSDEQYSFGELEGDLAQDYQDDDLRRIQSFDYLYKEEINLKIKESIHEITGKDQYFKEEEIIPEFMKSQVSQAQGKLLGNLYHKVFELLPDYLSNLEHSLWDVDTIEGYLKYLVEVHKVSDEVFSAINPLKILKFLETSLGQRVMEAKLRGEVYQEDSFMVGIPRNEISHSESKEPVILQGIIDLWFREKDKIIILDFKTDYVEQKNESILKERYGGQLRIYQKALAQIYDCDEVETYLYSVYLDKTIRLDD